MVRILFFILIFMPALQVLAQKMMPDKKPVSLPNGMAYRVTESWFDPNPPFLEFYRFGEKEKLSLSGSVFILLQDSRDDIWLTDQEGSNALIRFDGHEFKYFRFPDVDSISLGQVAHMVENADGKLWFSHEKGMSRYDPETESFWHFLMLPDSAKSVPDAFFDKRPSGNPSQNTFFDPLTGIFIRAFSAEVMDASDANNHTNATFHWIFKKGWRDANGHIWLNGVTPIGKGLVCVWPEEAKIILYPMRGILVNDKSGNPDYDPWNTDFYADTARNKIWVSGWRGGLRSFDLATKQWTQFAQGYKVENPQVKVDLETTLFIHPAPNGKLWLGTAHGLTLFDPETLHFQAWWDNDTSGCVQPGSHNAINAFTDREGRLWLAEGNFMVYDPKRFYFLRQVKMAAELRQKEAEFQQRLAEVQMSAQRAQMNPHFIFNSLSSINRFIQFNEPDVASNYLTKFSRLIRLILDNSRENVVTLHHELEACRLYIELESLRFADQFLYAIEISPTVKTEHINIPPLLIQPYLENAIWHGLMQKESMDRRLYLTISHHHQILSIVIEDNGIGREQSQVVKSKSITRQKSHGMHLTQERMKLYRLSVGLSIDVQIDDVLDSNSIVQGTRVSIFMQSPP